MVPDPSVDAGAIPQRQFPSARRGYDPGEVRAYLQELAGVVADLQRREERERRRADEASERAERAEHPDQNLLVEMLGEETARVLDAARDAARDIRRKAEAAAERLISEANEQARARRAEGETEVLALRSEMLAEVDHLRADAAGELERRRGEADRLVAEIRREAEVAADGLRQQGEKERAGAMIEAESLRDAAREEARRMVEEARAMRGQVLTDLTRRRGAAREQLERLYAARGRLLAAYEVVRRTADEATAELSISLPEAKAAADTARRRVQREPEPTADDMESQVSLARVAGLLPPLPEIDNAELEELLDPEPRLGAADDTPVQGAASNGDGLHRVGPEVTSGPRVETATEVEIETVALPPEPGAVEVSIEQPQVVEQVSIQEISADDAFARLRGAPTAPPADAVLLRQRDETLEPLERALARRLKRVLADEQNEVLDRVRRGQGPEEGPEDLLPEASAHAGRYRDAAADELSTAAYWGAASAGGQPGISCDDLPAELGRYLIEPLRERFARSVGEADGDADELNARLRAVYREWKMQRVADAARHFVTAAYARGAYDGAPEGARLRWVVDPAALPCPDAEDNALAGELRKGDPFPTGHCGPPAHPGCRCLTVVVDPDMP